MNSARVARILREIARLGLELADELDPPRKVQRPARVPMITPERRRRVRERLRRDGVDLDG